MRYEAFDDVVPLASGESDGPDSRFALPARRTTRREALVRRSCYSDQPADWRTRLVGSGATAIVLLTIFGSAFLTWHIVHPAVSVSEPLAVSLQPLSSPDAVREVPDGPPQVEQQKRPPVEKAQPIAPPPPSPLPDAPREAVPPKPPATYATAMKPVSETTAPKSLPAPRASQLSSNSSATWEAELLAHLEKYRRYPPAAKARREQGVTYVRFRMNREGKLLSSEILRSSGTAALDRAALDTLRRAQPFPPIPRDKPDPLELSVPVEFFVKR